jgi:dihydroorotate dehydrogenase
MLDIWSEIEPAALTLKTATRMDRTEPGKTTRGNRSTMDVLPRYGRSYYCDGLKLNEFHTYDDCRDQLVSAKKLLPRTKVGISVLATTEEKFEDLRSITETADFAELNLKYSMRITKPSGDYCSALASNWKISKELVEAFLKAFAGLPVFIKIPRELSWLPETTQCKELLGLISAHKNAGLVVANSRKMDVAKFIYEGEEQEFRGGVITGDILYDETIKLIWLLRKEFPQDIPIVATGGMVDEQQALMALRTGANAVQLCTAFTYYKPGYYRTLVSGLKARMKWRGVHTAQDFIERLRQEGVASIYSMPFVYYTAFWGDDLQKEIKRDIRYSDRMDVVVMSGYTLTEAWAEALESRAAGHKSVRFMLPNPNGDAFSAIQKSWGIIDQELEETRHHVNTARTRLEELFKRHAGGLTEEERKGVGWQVSYYDRCPFYSFYIFDDKVYLAQYPFHRPGHLASPVYVFFRSSPEYDRLDREWRGLEISTRLVKQD